MSLAVNELWLATLSRIRDRISEQQYETWFRNLGCREEGGGQGLVLEAPNRFSSSWLVDHYLEMIEDCIEDAAGRRLPVAVRARDEAAAQMRLPIPTQTSLPPPRHDGGMPLNGLYVFDTYVVGPCNALAHAAAVAVSESPGKSYNPLFIHSSTGMGKTHLLQACCHQIRANHPQLKILYLSCESFVNEFIGAVERGELETFRYNYRYVDVLVIDDVHFLANKERTQEEFFHTFNTLYHSQKQIILSSDSPPKEIPSLKERLVTRFKSGLVAKLEAPELETRIAIVRMKAKLLHRQIPPDVVEYIASRVTTSVRELEGAVVRAVGIASLTNRPLSVAVAAETVEDSKSAGPRIGISEIQTAVAERFGLKVADLQGKRRHKAVVLPRQICMYLAKELTTLSLVEIGGHFGGRDHTTVLYAVGKIRKLMESDSPLVEAVNRLRDSFVPR
jgi:chromosomal replication initiator protein